MHAGSLNAAAHVFDAGRSVVRVIFPDAVIVVQVFGDEHAQALIHSNPPCKYSPSQPNGRAEIASS
jgi:predicted methyltransferase